MPLDITISPLYRVGGRDQSSLPGLMAAVPPRKAARSRQQDRLVVYLVFGGEAAPSTGDCVQAASRAAVSFYETPGTVTAALRAAAGSINQFLQDWNQSRQAPGKYALGLLALVAVRDAQLTLLLSGPLHVFVLGGRGVRHISDSLSGHGLGVNGTPAHYFSQVELEANDRLVIGPKPPASWDQPLQDSSPASLEATRRRLMAAAPQDVNAVLLHAAEGSGMLTLLRASEDRAIARHVPGVASVIPSEARAEAVPLHSGQPRETRAAPDREAETAKDDSPPAPSVFDPRGLSAYAIPVDRAALAEDGSAVLDSSLASTGLPVRRDVQHAQLDEAARRAGTPRAQQAAKTLVSVVRASRQATGKVAQGMGNFIPRLLPLSEQVSRSFLSPAMMFVAVLVPLVIVTVATTVYFRYGRTVQYEQYLVQAQEAKALALGLTDAAAQREAWQRELFFLDRAEAYNETGETRTLRTEARQALDGLLGIIRLQFQPVLSSGVGGGIGRLAAGDNDVYLLDAERGAVLHVALTPRGFELDDAFECAPGAYDDVLVGPLVDILALPEVNSLGASLIGLDAGGNLLYCAPDQVAQAAALPPPDTNWGRVRAFTLDGGNLYVLDAQARAVWVYTGKDGVFVDRPYFFFEREIPEIGDAIDLAVSVDDLYVLHSDGRVSACSYGRVEAVPTRCTDPAALVNPFPAYRDQDIFSEAHFTQMMFSPAPDTTLSLLDADGQGVFRFSPRTLELQGQLRAASGKGNPLPPGRVTAMAFSPSHILYFALEDRLYYAGNAP